MAVCNVFPATGVIGSREMFQPQDPRRQTMTPETTENISDATQSGQDAPKGFEDMAKVMEPCGCCGMMEKMMSFMPAMCGSSDDGSGEAERGRDLKTDAKREDETGGKTGCG